MKIIGSAFNIPKSSFLPSTSYLTFHSEDGEFTLESTSKSWDGILEWSTNTFIWTEWSGSSISSLNGYLYVRGTNNSVITGDTTSRWMLTENMNISCQGNIETLLDYATVDAGQHPVQHEKCYYGLFSGCTSLTQSPELLSTNLATGCYGLMFSSCSNLAEPPELPATVLADRCYSSMFLDCTSLIHPPALPATTLNSMCYTSMFEGCTSLIQLPRLPAIQLESLCYSSMFFGCSNIRISSTRNSSYTYPYRIPTSGSGVVVSTSSLEYMFNLTGGTFTGTPKINTTYYTDNEPL